MFLFWSQLEAEVLLPFFFAVYLCVSFRICGIISRVYTRPLTRIPIWIDSTRLTCERSQSGFQLAFTNPALQVDPNPANPDRGERVNTAIDGSVLSE